MEDVEGLLRLAAGWLTSDVGGWTEDVSGDVLLGLAAGWPTPSS